MRFKLWFLLALLSLSVACEPTQDVSSSQNQAVSAPLSASHSLAPRALFSPEVTPVVDETPAAPPVLVPKGDPFPANCSVTPPNSDQKKILWGSKEDDPAEVLLGVRQELFGTHYYVSDEDHPEIFVPHIKDLGGAYIGIGSDQAYLYIGWMRPQVAWTIDYDAHIVAMHLINQSFFKEAEDYAAFYQLWRPKNTEKAKEVIEKYLGAHPEKKLIMKVLTKGQHRMPRRMREMRDTLGEKGAKGYMNDPETYTYVRNMIRNGCVRPMLGNLLAANGLKGIADSARDLGIPIRAFYLSNAEGYWKYGQTFRDNINSLPFDEKSVILRTQGAGANNDYRYNVQPAMLFAEWLKHEWMTSIYQMVRKVHVKGPDHFPITVLDIGPIEGKRRHDARRKKKRRKKKKSAE